MKGLPSKYARQDWFGPESFIGVVIGMVCISLPYTGLAHRDAIWLILGPPTAGVFFVALSAVNIPLGNSLRRAGVGLFSAFAGFVLAILGFLAGVAFAAMFT
ncbi:hypothetical protein [Nocardia xishanensis]